MARRPLLSLVLSAPLLIQIALFLHSDADLEIESDDAISLLQGHPILFNKAATSSGDIAGEHSPVKGIIVADNRAVKHDTPTLALVPTSEQRPTPASFEVTVDVHAVLAEYAAMTIFVIMGCGSAMNVADKPGYAWVLQVSLTFGLLITVLTHSIGHISGAQLNAAVTFGLVLIGRCHVVQGMANVVAQLLASITGAVVLCMVFPPEKDHTGNLAANRVQPGFTKFGVLVAEAVGTFLVVFTVLETRINPVTFPDRQIASLSIGFAVFLAHSVLIPIDGCSVNPSRSFGPAVVASCVSGRGNGYLRELWIFFVGPLTGAAAAVFIFLSFGIDPGPRL